MAEQPRASARGVRPTGGVTAALRRRTKMPTAPVAVVEYSGYAEDTPMIELLKGVKPESQTFRSGEHIHVSDVIGKCIRKIALMRQLNLRHPQESIMEGKAITFAIGDALHDYVKGRFAKGHPEKVWADWKCKCGATLHRGTLADRKVKTCDECNTAVDQHNEVPFIDPEFLLKGTPDLLLWMDEYGAYYIIEIKSMAANAWNELAMPLPDHKVQIALYWSIMKKAGLPLVDRVSVLYVNKEYSFKFPYKEYMIDPLSVDLSPYIEDLEALKAHTEGGALPPRITCGSNTAPEAKKCSVCVTCFGLPE